MSQSRNDIQRAELHVLLERMDSAQNVTFKRAAVLQSISFIKPLIKPGDDSGCACGVECAQRWLADPSDKNRDDCTIRAAMDAIDGGVRYFDYPDFYWDPAYAAGAETSPLAAKYATQAARNAIHSRLQNNGIRDDEMNDELFSANEAALEWQIQAAKNILSGQDAPATPAISPIDFLNHEQVLAVQMLSAPLKIILKAEVCRGNTIANVAKDAWTNTSLAISLKRAIDLASIQTRLGFPNAAVTFWQNTDTHYSVEAGFRDESTGHSIAGPLH